MNQKIEITNFIIKQLNLISSNEKQFKNWIYVIWQNPRIKSKGGLKLTDRGFELLLNAGIKCHDIRLENNYFDFDNKFILWLDQYFDCPFYLTRKKIFIFNDKTAVQLILFSGNLYQLYLSQNKFVKKQQVN